MLDAAEVRIFLHHSLHAHAKAKKEVLGEMTSPIAEMACHSTLPRQNQNWERQRPAAESTVKTSGFKNAVVLHIL